MPNTFYNHMSKFINIVWQSVKLRMWKECMMSPRSSESSTYLSWLSTIIDRIKFEILDNIMPSQMKITVYFDDPFALGWVIGYDMWKNILARTNIMQLKRNTYYKPTRHHIDHCAWIEVNSNVNNYIKVWPKYTYANILINMR